MCLTVPMRVDEIDGLRARCSALGEERWANLMLMGDDPPRVGDYVMIQLGYVQRVVPEEDARQSYELLQQIAQKLDEE